MMTRIIILIALFIINSIRAQDFQGVVTYKTDRKLDMKLDSTQLNSDMQRQIQEMMRKQFQKEFTLRFNKTESLYKEEKSLGVSQPAGMQVVMIGGGESDELYKNVKEERFSSQRELMGKTFLVKDQLKAIDWKLENETKKIGNYTCYKATAKIMRPNIGRNFDEDENIESEPEELEINVTAWYTPEIPISNGPESYWGLPGLILETNDGQQMILCNKIVLNTKKKIEINEPTKGKVITSSKFESIMEKKMKEMRDRMPRRRDGEGIQIRIGG